MTPARAKRVSLLAAVLFAGLSMLAWAQPWSHLRLDVAGTASDIVANGADASLPVMALALAALACTAALAMAGKAWRIILAVLLVLLGAGVAVAAALAASDPAAGMLAPVGEATAIGGENAIRQVIATGEITVTAWPIVAMVGGVGIALSGAVAMFTAHRWAGGGSRYDRDASGEHTAEEAAGDTRVSQWDALSAGDDQTDEQTTSGRVD
jgi:uncharacterized membrane protein (TIGR02234 family)